MTIATMRKLIAGKPGKMKIVFRRNLDLKNPMFLDQPDGRGKVINAVRWPAGCVSDNRNNLWTDYEGAKPERLFLIE